MAVTMKETKETKKWKILQKYMHFGKDKVHMYENVEVLSIIDAVLYQLIIGKFSTSGDHISIKS